MDFSWVQELQKDFTGPSLTATKKELIILQSSVALLCEKFGHDLSLYLGKVRGTSRDYHLVKCYTNGLLGQGTAYASVDGVSWFGLPYVTSEMIRHCAQIRGRYTGYPLTQSVVRHPRVPTSFKNIEPLVPPKPKSEEEEEEEEEEKEEKPEEEEEEEEEVPEFLEYTITEDQRLAVLVHQIFGDDFIYPRGALMWENPNSVKYNPLFNGVPTTSTIEDFFRFRRQDGEIRRDEIVSGNPSLLEDLPSTSWDIATVNGSNVVQLRSRIWPGLMFICDGYRWGTVYFGTGERNTDFLFTTQ